VTAIAEPATLESLWTTIIFTVASVAIELALGLLVATLLARVTLEYGGRFGRFLAAPSRPGLSCPSRARRGGCRGSGKCPRPADGPLDAADRFAYRLVRRTSR